MAHAKKVRKAVDFGVSMTVFVPAKLRVALDTAAQKEKVSRSEVAARVIAREIGFPLDAEGRAAAKAS